MAGLAKKPVEQRQRRNAPKRLEVVAELRLEAPPASKGWLKATRDVWDGFWLSDVAAVVDRSSDMAAIRRLFALYDERERSVRVFDRERLTTGSTGQVVVHPLGAHIAKLDATIQGLEDRFGLTPRARLNLGLQVSAVAQTLDRMNARFGDDEIITVEVEADEQT